MSDRRFLVVTFLAWAFGYAAGTAVRVHRPEYAVLLLAAGVGTIAASWFTGKE